MSRLGTLTQVFYSFMHILTHSYSKDVPRTLSRPKPASVMGEQQTRQTGSHSPEIIVLKRLKGKTHQNQNFLI